MICIVCKLGKLTYIYINFKIYTKISFRLVLVNGTHTLPPPFCFAFTFIIFEILLFVDLIVFVINLQLKLCML
jgi:hypothetical protein